MVEYNLTEYLKTESETSGFNYSINGSNEATPEEAVIITAPGGDPAHWFGRTDHQIQIVSRAKSKTRASKISNIVYNKIIKRFGLVLPVVTIDGDILAEVTTARIVPIQSPGYVGADEAGREMFSFNLTITTT